MPDFRYRSINREGKTIAGIASAADENSLASLLQDQGQVLIEARLNSGQNKNSASAAPVSTEAKRKVKRIELIRFTYNFQAIISAGVPIVKGLESLLEEALAAESGMAPVIQGLILKIKSGESFSKSLAEYPNVFPDLYINLVAAGEASGNLETILIDIAENLEWQEEIRGTLKQATIYPTIVLSAVFGLIMLIMVFVVPQFTDIFNKMNIPLPTATKVLIAIGEFSSKYWHLILGFPFALLIAFKIFGRTKAGRYWIEVAKIKTPLFGTVIMKIALSRFAKNLSVLNNAGVTITESLLICEKIAGNPVLEEAVASTRDQVMRGESLAKSMAGSDVFPVLVRNMVAVGEESGKLGPSLSRISQFYDREVKMGLKRAFTILEPAITIFLAAIVGGIAVAIISTLYKAITMVGKS